MLKRVIPFFTLGWSSTPSEPKAWSKGGYLYTPVPNLQTGNLPTLVNDYTSPDTVRSGVNSYDLIKEPNPNTTLNYGLYGDISPNPNNSPILQFPAIGLSYTESQSKLCCLWIKEREDGLVDVNLLLRTSELGEQKANIYSASLLLYEQGGRTFTPMYVSFFGERTPEQVFQFLNTYGVAPLAKKQEYVASQVPPDSELANTFISHGSGDIFSASTYEEVFIFSFDIWALEGNNNTTLPTLHNKYPNQSVRLGPEYGYLMGNDVLYEFYRDTISKDSEVYTKCFANPEIKRARNIGIFASLRAY